MNPAINVGANKEAVEAARDAILAILNCGAEQKTVRLALKSFTSICEVKYVTISDCIFYGDGTVAPRQGAE